MISVTPSANKLSTKKPNYKSEISAIFRSALRDVEEMCTFNAKGQSLHQLKQKKLLSEPEENPEVPVENSLKSYLEKYADEISITTGIPKQEILKDCQRIWKVMPSRSQGYYQQLLSRPDDSPQEHHNSFWQGNLKREQN